MTCYLICAADFSRIEINPADDDLIVAVDGGYEYCIRNGVTPNIVLGDFDSLKYEPDVPFEKIKLPVEKDDTDLVYAVKLAYARGYRRFVSYCALGGSRWDHTMANIHLTALMSQLRCEFFLKSKNGILTALTDGKISFNKNCTGDMGLLSFSDESIGVTEKGFKYETTDRTLKSTDILTVSNSFTGIESEIYVKNGTLVIYFTGDESQVRFDYDNR